MAVAMCTVVTVAATGEKDGHFDMVWAKQVILEQGLFADHVSVGKNSSLNSVISLGNRHDVGGYIQISSAEGNAMVSMNETENGGTISVMNKWGIPIVGIKADKYGIGEVHAWGRKGKEPTLKPGP